MIKACSNINAEIFVVDNNSSDGSKEFFDSRFPQVKFIWKYENSGFAKANNEAVKLCSGEKILFLNPDTILPEDCLEKCLSFFDQQKNIGALGVRMIDGSGNFLPESKRGFPSFFTSFCKMTGLTALLPKSKIFARYYLGHLAENENNEVDVLSGAFMMLDKNVIKTTGSFDDNYFMYAEDIDLSYRIQKAGYKNLYFADTAIIHFKGESVVKQSPEYIRNFYGTMILFIQKHYTGFSKAVYVWLLKFFIRFRSLFTVHDKKENSPAPGKVFMLADYQLFASQRTMTDPIFQDIQQVKNISEVPAAEAILFCEPFISFKEMIALMQQYKNQYAFYIHADSTKSVVGSSDKNHPGTTYPF